MSIYAISDLHLALSVPKPMDIFKGWENSTERIKANWCRIVKEEDTVILPGDFSWGLKLEETLEDFKFIDALPGKKILLKGNHDLWWSTVTKINNFFSENNIKSVELLYNNAILVEGKAICGTRGWLYDAGSETKIRKRELGRLKLSLDFAKKISNELLVFLHYPPVYREYVCEDILSLLDEYGVKTVYHGHIHGSGFNSSVSNYGGLEFKLISADCVDFTPILVYK